MKRLLHILILMTLTISSFAQDFEKPKLLSKAHWGFGGGITVSSLPVASSEFKMPMTQLYYDYAFGSSIASGNGIFRPGLSVGLYGLNGFVPIPEAELLALINEEEDLSLRLGLGGFYDILIGGHSGISLKLGVIINKEYQFDIISVPKGNPPVKPYSELVDGGPEDIKTPYFGILFSWRYATK
jgi:hypothetical protein